MTIIPTLFDQQPTLERKNEANNNRTPQKDRSALIKVLKSIQEHQKLTSRAIAEKTGIERTSVTRVLAENKKYFNDALHWTYTKNGRTYHPTWYQLSDEGIKFLREAK